jgi:murein DD-endopeptidase MepM/ murein hydrolase activator NlpD
MHRLLRLPFLVLIAACSGISSSETTNSAGCVGASYPEIATSPYVIPFAVGMTVATGLGNCSSSFHASGADQFATDFNLPAGTPFVAARGGIVSGVVEDQPSGGGGAGNRLSVDHGDGTSGLYLHSPRDGILVEVGDRVEQGDTLGLVGQSGLAGYPHLHFIVVEGSTAYPYEGVPVTFRNADPADVALRTNGTYRVLPY